MSFHDSIELTKSKSTDLETKQKQDFADQFSMHQPSLSHRKYGKMLVLLQTDRILITLGPDYLCFIFTFIGFLIAGIFLCVFVNSAFELIFIKAINIIFVTIQLLSYLAVALSNPGVVLQQNMTTSQAMQASAQGTQRYCLKCKLRLQRNMKHCKSCDVCIRDYDHHCPWISKCIGGSNIRRFYLFVTITPFYIIYFMIMLMVSLALTSTNQINKL